MQSNELAPAKQAVFIRLKMAEDSGHQDIPKTYGLIASIVHDNWLCDPSPCTFPKL
jgi:hypothetical protein